MRAPAISGYTILEVTLFIVISSSMFLLAITAFSGRQRDIQFTQAVREFDATLQDVINDVSTGYFDNNRQISCKVPGVDRPELSSNPADIPATEQGKNSVCVFIGKAIQFTPNQDGNPAVSLDEATKFNVYTLVGRRKTAAGLPASTLEDAKPVALAPSTAKPTLFDSVNRSTLKYGLQIRRVAQKDEGTVPPTKLEYGSIGFFSGFARAVGDTQLSDSQLVKVGVIPGSTAADSAITAVDTINTVTDSSSAPAPGAIDLSSTKPIVICLTDDSGSRNASITIGGEGRATTRVDFDSYDRDVC